MQESNIFVTGPVRGFCWTPRRWNVASHLVSTALSALCGVLKDKCYYAFTKRRLKTILAGNRSCVWQRRRKVCQTPIINMTVETTLFFYSPSIWRSLKSWDLTTAEPLSVKTFTSNLPNPRCNSLLRDHQRPWDLVQFSEVHSRGAFVLLSKHELSPVCLWKSVLLSEMKCKLFRWSVNNSASVMASMQPDKIIHSGPMLQNHA